MARRRSRTTRTARRGSPGESIGALLIALLATLLLLFTLMPSLAP
ncbi:MAG: hypothetical protein AAF624_18885 [Bacteroidota bacterium]